jgi:hypothetical protein
LFGRRTVFVAFVRTPAARMVIVWSPGRFARVQVKVARPCALVVARSGETLHVTTRGCTTVPAIGFPRESETTAITRTVGADTIESQVDFLAARLKQR